jgi:hypothetical protein
MIQKLGNLSIWVFCILCWAVFVFYQLGGEMWLINKFAPLPKPVVISADAQQQYLVNLSKDNAWIPTFKDQNAIKINGTTINLIDMKWDFDHNKWKQDPRGTSSAWMHSSYYYKDSQNRVIYIDPEITPLSKSSRLEINLSDQTYQATDNSKVLNYDSLKTAISNLPAENLALVEVPLSKQTSNGYYILTYLKKP